MIDKNRFKILKDIRYQRETNRIKREWVHVEITHTRKDGRMSGQDMFWSKNLIDARKEFEKSKDFESTLESRESTSNAKIFHRGKLIATINNDGLIRMLD